MPTRAESFFPGRDSLPRKMGVKKTIINSVKAGLIFAGLTVGFEASPVYAQGPQDPDCHPVSRQSVMISGGRNLLELPSPQGVPFAAQLEMEEQRGLPVMGVVYKGKKLGQATSFNFQNPGESNRIYYELLARMKSCEIKSTDNRVDTDKLKAEDPQKEREDLWIKVLAVTGVVYLLARKRGGSENIRTQADLEPHYNNTTEEVRLLDEPELNSMVNRFLQFDPYTGKSYIGEDDMRYFGKHQREQIAKALFYHNIQSVADHTNATVPDGEGRCAVFVARILGIGEYELPRELFLGYLIITDKEKKRFKVKQLDGEVGDQLREVKPGDQIYMSWSREKRKGLFGKKKVGGAHVGIVEEVENGWFGLRPHEIVFFDNGARFQTMRVDNEGEAELVDKPEYKVKVHGFTRKKAKK